MGRRWLVGIACLMPAVVLFDPNGATHFYLDAGTGSIVLQAVLGALVAALLAIKLFWTQIKAFFARLFRREGAHASQPESEE